MSAEDTLHGGFHPPPQELRQVTEARKRCNELHKEAKGIK